jgi:hypothetical protein
MAKSKIRKFGYGGFADLNQPVKPLPGFASLTMAPGSQSGSGGAYGGLDTVNQGSQQIGQSLQTIGDALGKPGGQGRPYVYDNLGAQLGASQGLGAQLGARLGMKKGGAVKSKKMASGGKVGQLSKADGCATKGKSKGKMIKMKHGGAC